MLPMPLIHWDMTTWLNVSLTIVPKLAIKGVLYYPLGNFYCFLKRDSSKMTLFPFSDFQWAWVTISRIIYPGLKSPILTLYLLVIIGLRSLLMLSHLKAKCEAIRLTLNEAKCELIIFGNDERQREYITVAFHQVFTDYMLHSLMASLSSVLLLARTRCIRHWRRKLNLFRFWKAN